MVVAPAANENSRQCDGTGTHRLSCQWPACACAANGIRFHHFVHPSRVPADSPALRGRVPGPGGAAFRDLGGLFDGRSDPDLFAAERPGLGARGLELLAAEIGRHVASAAAPRGVTQ